MLFIMAWILCRIENLLKFYYLRFDPETFWDFDKYKYSLRATLASWEIDLLCRRRDNYRRKVGVYCPLGIDNGVRSSNCGVFDLRGCITCGWPDGFRCNWPTGDCNTCPHGSDMFRECFN